jgi:hypothetical protein
MKNATGMYLSALHRLSQSYEHNTPSSLPSYNSTPDPDRAMRQCMELEKEQQWLELTDYLIKQIAIRRRLLADMHVLIL